MKIAVIGGGIVGLATAYRLKVRFPDIDVLVFEKESGPARHQTGNNSGVLHCGLYYVPGSLKARLAVTGIRQMVQFCEEHRIPFELCGKVVVATQSCEIPRLRALYDRGIANGLQGLRLIGPEQLRELEPKAAGIEALHVPQEGIVDYIAVSEALVRCLRDLGAAVIFDAKVLSLHNGSSWTVVTTCGDYHADFVVNCAGLHSDRVSRLTGSRDATRIIPFRGEYYRLKPEKQYLVRNLIYPVPDPSFPFLGVHFTRLIRGGVEAGPNAVLALAREGYKKSDVVFRDIVEIVGYSGFWRFLKRYPMMCLAELARSFSRELFCRSLQRLVPEITTKDLMEGGAGVRAQGMTPRGELLQDFYFVEQKGILHVLNAPSPAATASLAIADEIILQAQDVLKAQRQPF